MDKSMPLGFEDLQLGDRWESAPRNIGEDDIQDFADLTGDQDPLHTDPVFAASGPFGKPVAHGLLGLSFLAGLSSRAPHVLTSAFVTIKNWSFTKPVYVGDRVHVVTEILDLKAHGRRHGEVHWYRRLVNQDGQTVQEGIFVTLVTRRVPLSVQRQRIGEMSRSASESVQAEASPAEVVAG
jgi:3-hydroxybutyryl-CoA dehydratase